MLILGPIHFFITISILILAANQTNFKSLATYYILSFMLNCLPHHYSKYEIFLGAIEVASGRDWDCIT